MRSDLRKRELTSLIYLILRLLNSNSLWERERESERNRVGNFCEEKDNRRLVLWAFSSADYVIRHFCIQDCKCSPYYWALLGHNFGLNLNVDQIIFIFILIKMIFPLIYNAQLLIIIRVRHWFIYFFWV